MVGGRGSGGIGRRWPPTERSCDGAGGGPARQYPPPSDGQGASMPSLHATIVRLRLALPVSARGSPHPLLILAGLWLGCPSRSHRGFEERRREKNVESGGWIDTRAKLTSTNTLCSYLTVVTTCSFADLPSRCDITKDTATLFRSSVLCFSGRLTCHRCVQLTRAAICQNGAMYCHSVRDDAVPRCGKRAWRREARGRGIQCDDETAAAQVWETYGPQLKNVMLAVDKRRCSIAGAQAAIGPLIRSERTSQHGYEGERGVIPALLLARISAAIFSHLQRSARKDHS